MKLKLFQVDAFTEKVFKGNPAAVCPLEKWISDETMQLIAAENNLSETAFIVKEDHGYKIRWFTPSVEVDLCGHATLASASVIFNELKFDGDEITFRSNSGDLKVHRDGHRLTMDFPADPPSKTDNIDQFNNCFNLRCSEAFKGKSDFLLLFDSEEIIKSLVPVLAAIERIDCRGIIVTAKGNDVDFVSRFFAPQSGVNEDPVTGSAHTTLTPFWSERLGKKEMKAIQLSERQGYLECRNLGSRVEISGFATKYLEGEIEIMNA